MIEGMNMYGTKAAFDLQFGARRQMQMPAGARGEGGEMPEGMPSMGEGGIPDMGERGMPDMEGREGGMPGMMGREGGQAETEMSDEDIEKNIETMLTEANFYKNHGFGVAIMRGGSNKASLAAFKALRSAWPDVIIMSRLSVGGSVEDAVSEAKKLEGYVDILTVQDSDASKSHCMSHNSEKNNPGSLKYVEALKKAGINIAVAPNGGYQSLDKNEEYIATGKCDMIAMGRAFIADPDYAKKAYDGRGEDVTPCLLCNKCHGVSFTSSWFSVCAVNPKLGICQAVQKIEAPTASKKVAVIGGGPAGMKAAVTAAERGHKVTLYEKSGVLGGQLMHADYSPYKWTYKDFKDYLIRQVKKNGVEVKLNTATTPDMIKKEGYDAVMVALGSDVVTPNIPGADGNNVYNVYNVYAREKELGKNVVVVGAGEIGVETGMFLANAGHNVTVLASDRQLMDRGGPHQGEIVQEIYRSLENFSTVTQAIPTRISKGKVAYKDTSGDEKSIPADSVVIYSGRKPRQDEAVKFSGLATQFYIIGDCTGNCGNVQKSIRNAFFVASQV
jgi:thioredoxin reductase